MKVLFCNIAWMKYYHGSTEGDRPINGGKHIDKNQDGGEIFNFTHFNRKYYGYVWAGEDIHIERFEGVGRSTNATNDVLVVWMASNPKKTGVFIVGWYKNATVYRQMHELCTNIGEIYNYNITSDVKDGVLLSEEDRTFPIPLASKAGKGKGKGQSNIWYAEDNEIRRDFLPKVISYIENWSKPSADKTYTPDELWQPRVIAEGKSVEELMALEEMHEDYFEILKIRNTICATYPSVDSYYNRAVCLWNMGYCEEALEDLRYALTLNINDLSIINQIADYDWVMGRYKQALSKYEDILSGLETDDKVASYWKGPSLSEIKLSILMNLSGTHMCLEEGDQTAKYLRIIIKDYPDTEEAESAKHILSQLGYV